MSATAFGYDLDVRAINDPSIPIGIEGGNDLLNLVDASITGSTHTLTDIHDSIISSFGEEGLVDSASVFGNFEMMNRVAEGTGIPIPSAVIEELKGSDDVLGLISLLKS